MELGIGIGKCKTVGDELEACEEEGFGYSQGYDGLHGSGGNSDGVSVFGHNRDKGETDVASHMKCRVVKQDDVEKAIRAVPSDVGSGGSVSWMNSSVVAETVDSSGNSKEGPNKVVVSETTSTKMCDDKIGVRLDGQLDGQVITSGFMKSLSAADRSWPEVYLEKLKGPNIVKEKRIEMGLPLWVFAVFTLFLFLFYFALCSAVALCSTTIALCSAAAALPFNFPQSPSPTPIYNDLDVKSKPRKRLIKKNTTAKESTPDFGIKEEDDKKELGDFVREESDYDDFKDGKRKKFEKDGIGGSRKRDRH
ncbi:hypothetical protein LOK49_LG05G00892 [Camellia lanceoleosa]|uniref:Uncharacterized protein n=1 Tax=Camellia lanceoleosa TaxID=1840588 RepID=A0ACC0HRV6_9ERIC|nr:hypothetical protein LOK49_LG05G00892 [Camellia lanceoleosa]